MNSPAGRSETISHRRAFSSASASVAVMGPGELFISRNNLKHRKTTIQDDLTVADMMNENDTEPTGVTQSPSATARMNQNQLNHTRGGSVSVSSPSAVALTLPPRSPVGLAPAHSSISGRVGQLAPIRHSRTNSTTHTHTSESVNDSLHGRAVDSPAVLPRLPLPVRYQPLVPLTLPARLAQGHRRNSSCINVRTNNTLSTSGGANGTEEKRATDLDEATDR